MVMVIITLVWGSCVLKWVSDKEWEELLELLSLGLVCS